MPSAQKTTTPPPDPTMYDAAMLLSGAALIAAGRERRRPGTVIELARRMIPTYKLSPALVLISDVLTDAIVNPGRRVLITTSPRTGKSVLMSQVGPLYALMHNVDANLLLISYADDLARELSHQARALLNEHADYLGFKLSQDRKSVARWRVAGHRGGLLAAGVMSGRPTG